MEKVDIFSVFVRVLKLIKMTKIYILKHPATQTNLFKGNISSVCTGRLKTYGGFKWKYKNEDIV